MIQFDPIKLETAIKYIERMADGKNPVKNTPADIDSVLNNPNVIRCMYFIKDVLSAVKDNNGIIGGPVSRTQKAAFPFECLEKYQYQSDRSISLFLGQLKALANNPGVKGIGAKTVTDWLKAKGYLVDEVNKFTGEKRTRTTTEGEEFGLYMEQRTSMKGNEYQVVMYSRKAQEFLTANLEKIVNGETL